MKYFTAFVQCEIGMSVPVTNAELEELLKVVGNEMILAYRDKYFPARIIQACPNIYSVENAASWVKPDKFCAFVAHALQEQSPPPTPSTRRTELGSDSEHVPLPPSKRVRAASPVAEGDISRLAPCNFSADSFESGESDVGVGACSVSSIGTGAGTGTGTAGQKRKRSEEKARAVKPCVKRAAGLVKVTRQCWVSRVERRVEAPENWRVPEAGESVAYVLDLTESPSEYKDAKGKDLAMSAIIKHKVCTDGWAGGSGGSLSKATAVSVLGEAVKCQKISHECRGAFVCSLGVWDNYRRHECNVGTVSMLSPPSDVEGPESHVHIKEALRFYNNVIKEKCQFENGRCSGRVVLKPYDQIPVDGKSSFICCSAWKPGAPDNAHSLRQIPRQVDESVVRQLFATGRNNFSNTIVSSASCTFQVPPRTGLKQKNCPHVHVRDGRIVEGVILHRPCPAKITIFSPVNHAVRKAAVIPTPGLLHNHPPHPSDKLTRREKAALKAACQMEMTPGADDCAPSTAGNNMDADCGLNSQLSDAVASASASSSLPALASGSSISTALLPTGYHMNQYY